MAAPKLRPLVNPLRILLIEDDEGDRDLALEYLEADRRRMYITTWAQSLEEGLERLETNAFDIIILDLVLPDSKGVATVSKLCAQSRGIPVVVSSYFDEDALASKVIELGAQDYLAKDLMNSQRLGRIISRALARAKHQAEALVQQRLRDMRSQAQPDPLATKIEQLQSDVKRLEAISSSVSQSYEAQQNISDVRQQMIKTLSHECRSPATVILLATNVLKGYGASVEDEQYLTAITRIDEAVRQMMKLLDNAISFQRIQTITQDEAVEIVDLEALCESVVADLTTVIEPAPVFHTHYEGDCQHVQIYKAAIEQILRQLLTNAAQYSSPPAQVEVSIQRPDHNRLVVAVADRGRGISDEARSHIFEAFYRASCVDDTHGIGLGLTIVKACVDICGGQIEVDSQLERGTTVSVTLPLKDALVG